MAAAQILHRFRNGRARFGNIVVCSRYEIIYDKIQSIAIPITTTGTPFQPKTRKKMTKNILRFQYRKRYEDYTHTQQQHTDPCVGVDPFAIKTGRCKRRQI